jgi:hypothetical protein
MRRKKWYESLVEMQKDLDTYLNRYNRQRPHPGRNMNGKTLLKAMSKSCLNRKRGQNGDAKGRLINNQPKAALSCNY